MQSLESKKAALRDLLKIVQGFIMEDSKKGGLEKPDMSPEHEAKEDPSIEIAEHMLDVELSPEDPKEEAAESPEEENQEEKNPFGTQAERIARNQYRGGKAKSTVAGAMFDKMRSSKKGK